jgi:hypothetical protein
MSAISLRLSESLHEKAGEVARQESVSVNQLISLALAEKLSALLAEDYLVMRARQGDLAKFGSAMAKVSDEEPEEDDRL